MMSQKVTPLKVGLLIVVLAYFLFNAHSLFNLSWVGEWNRLTNNSTARFDIYMEDVTAAVGVVFRFAAGIIAVVAVLYYFTKGLPSTAKLYNILKIIIVFEAIYWFGLIATAAVEVHSLITSPFHSSIINLLTSMMTGTIPAVVESVAFPIVLLILAFKLNPNKPSATLKWTLITGTFLIFVFWLTNTSIWISIWRFRAGIGVTNYPVNTVSFILTVFGLLALAISSVGFTVVSLRSKPQPKLNLKAAGVFITAFGMYFLWNYLTWIFFGGNYLWSNWYAWFLGHNLDLWMLSLPLLGLPMLFSNRDSQENLSS